MKSFGRWFDSSHSDDAELVGREDRQAKQEQAALHGLRSARVAQAWPLETHVEEGFCWRAEENGGKEIVGCTKAASQIKQDQWVNWEGLEKRKINWRELWRMEASRIGFMIGATYDELPSLQKLHQWLGENAACPQ